MASVGFRDVHKTFGGKVKAIQGISFDIHDGEFIVLVGPSGCGKSTLLRMLAGLEEISGGEILIDDKVINDVDSVMAQSSDWIEEQALNLVMNRAKNYGAYKVPALGTLPVNFLSTVDITNGNSGSSTLNAKGEFVGLAFDGTLDGVISDWAYDPASNRTIHVDSRFMLWTMEKVDGATRLLEEMGVK